MNLLNVSLVSTIGAVRTLLKAATGSTWRPPSICSWIALFIDSTELLRREPGTCSAILLDSSLIACPVHLAVQEHANLYDAEDWDVWDNTPLDSETKRPSLCHYSQMCSSRDFSSDFRCLIDLNATEIRTCSFFFNCDPDRCLSMGYFQVNLSR